MNVTNIIKGLEVIQKSKPESESDYHFRAEHDTIYVGSLEWPMSEEDRKIMAELGWHANKEIDGWVALV